MQFSFLPTAPHHCRCTPGVLSPFLTSLVSSMIPMECGAGVLVADDLPGAVVAQPVLVPAVLAEELLQGPAARRRSSAIGSTLFSGMVGELPGDVHRQVGAGVLPGEAVVEPGQELRQLRLQLANLLDVHVRTLRGQARASLKPLTYARSKIRCSTNIRLKMVEPITSWLANLASVP